MITHNGKQYARVTEVLAGEIDFSGIDPSVLQNKARIGTSIHQGINEFIHGEPPILAKDEIGYFASFKKWKDACNPIFVESEARYYNEEKMITGCIDTLIKFHDNGPLILIDYKTSAQVHTLHWGKQAHLYHFLVQQSGKQIYPIFLFIKLDKRGEMPTIIKITYDEELRKRCLCLVDKFWLTQNLILKNTGT